MTYNVCMRGDEMAPRSCIKGTYRIFLLDVLWIDANVMPKRNVPCHWQVARMKRTHEEDTNWDTNSGSKHRKMNNVTLTVDPKPLDNGEKHLRYIDSKIGNDKIPLQKTNVSKKLVIKNFGLYSVKWCKNILLTSFTISAKPRLPEDYLAQTWEKLNEAVISIQNSKPAATPLEELYQAVQNLCSNKMAPTIYGRLRLLTENHVSKVVQQFLQPCSDNLSFLRLIEKCWGGFCNQMVNWLSFSS